MKKAYKIISDVANKTSVMQSRTLDAKTNAKRVLVKCENFQRTGSFKFRGAWNCISQIPIDQRKRGIIAHSSGNFAQAVALVAKILSIKATIVMPENATPSKIEATKGYGANIIFSGSNIEDRERVTQEQIDTNEYRLVHPYDDYNVIFGGGTTALEFINQIGTLDLLLAPIGGGGLISGCSIAAKGYDPRIKIIGVEPKNADDAYKSFTQGKLIPVVNPNTIADGLRTSLGTKTFPIIQELVSEIITVSEEHIIDAMKFYWERMKLVVEPSGAVPLAGLLYGDIDPSVIKNKKIGIIISGGNIDVSTFFNTMK